VESGPSEVILGFALASPAVATNLAVDVTYRSPADPEAKPPAATLARLELPVGTRFNNDSVPVCTASDVQLRLLGRAACPAGSKVGGGQLVGMTGLPVPDDRLVADVVGYNTGDGVAMVAFVPNTSVVVAIDRASTQGNVFTARPPLIPGGPPDLYTAIRTINLVFPAGTGFVTTPDRCSADRRWDYSATLGFADGTTQTATGVIPCTR
jgi:hypothetical protein